MWYPHGARLKPLRAAAQALGAHGGKRSKVTRDRDRDVSEKIALGQANTGAKSAEALYDQRLFNQDQVPPHVTAACLHRARAWA